LASAGRLLPVGDAAPRALAIEPHALQLAEIGADGHIRVYALDGGEQTRDVAPGATRVIAIAHAPGDSAFAMLGEDGRVRVQAIDWKVSYAGGSRAVIPEASPVDELGLGVDASQVRAFTARTAPTHSTAAAALADGSLILLQETVRLNEFSGERDEKTARSVVPGAQGLTLLEIDPEQRVLYGADAGGRLFTWELGADGAHGPDTADGGAPVTALSLLVGGRSLVAGHADGSLSVWFRVRTGRARTELVRAHHFDSQGAAIRALAPSGRGRSFLALGADGALGLYHSTSERVLWRGEAGIKDGSALAFATRGNAAFVAGAGEVRELTVASLHPEVSLSALFGRVWYEDYPEPAYVWQSTGGSEESEPKLSLAPLAFGTLKGTFYALFFAIPLGVLGALYTSQVMDPRLQRSVKPAVEIMASLPSVVLGFLAGLWLAPRLENVFPGFLAGVVVGPVLALLAGALYAALPARFTRRLPVGTEVALSAAFLFAGGALCFKLSPGLERVFFAGDFSAWLREATGATYDPRNAIVAGVAMAFAVIPIVFAIAEESLSNVPRTLSAASLALGATRWQTIARVVLPAASPGLFAAIMIGFGRAVGETMIVLMATGNTPLIDLSPFNGFRTLSANIAVEIPEAAQGATLYRVLFLSALLLFVVTFAANGLADVVRERLRRRYSGT
ncbi:MAG TPA: ABC transporter permease subunit, partial [Myxococcota bacterium]|nr:ABC transporter permease subunit [Myxococcota bacterium]